MTTPGRPPPNDDDAAAATTTSARTGTGDVYELIANHHRTTSSDFDGALGRTQSAATDGVPRWSFASLFTRTRSVGSVGTVREDNEEEELELVARPTPTPPPEVSNSKGVDDDEDDKDDDDDDDDDDASSVDSEHTPESARASKPWFNPEQFTAEKRRWLRDRRSMDMDMESLNLAGASTQAMRTFESFLVCGLEPSADVGVVADSPAAAREARQSGDVNAGGVNEPKKLRAYRGTAGATYKAKVLYQYPDVSEEEATFSVEEVAAFCFPHGVEPRLLERTPSMSKLQEMMCGQSYADGDDHTFVFQVQSKDNTPMYGVCAYVTEVVQQAPPIVQHRNGVVDVSFDALPTPMSASSDSPNQLRRRYLKVAPRCYCLLTRTPFFRTHFEVLTHVLGMERVERIKQNMQMLMLDEGSNAAPVDARLGEEMTVESPATPRQLRFASSSSLSSDQEDVTPLRGVAPSEATIILKNYLACEIPELGNMTRAFVPSEGVKPIQFPRPRPTEKVPRQLSPMSLTMTRHHFSMEEEAFHLQGWAIVTLCCCLSLENIIALLTAVLLEKQIVVFSNNLGELSAVSLGLIPMLRPFRWQSLFLPILPQHMIDFLDAPVPFVCGVQHKNSELRARTINLTRINVYKDDVKVQWEGKTLRLPRLQKLLQNLRPLHESVQAAAVRYKRRPVIDPPQDAVEAAGVFLNAWRAYLNSLVANIRYHSITDVNEGGSEKVSILLKDSFLATFEGKDRSFMSAFVETQMFSTYADERLADRAN